MILLSRKKLMLALLFLSAASGCRQKMSDQPYHRPLQDSDLFEDGRASRPLERGVIHRGQYLPTDPMATGLTRDEWVAFYKHKATLRDAAGKDAPAPKVEAGVNADQLQEANKKIAFGSPRFDPVGFDATKFQGGTPKPGSPVYVNEFPFKIEESDLRRGKERYTIYCAVCHGPLGNGQGKIWERGYLVPTSFHTARVDASELDLSAKTPRDLPLGYSRGFGLWGIKIPLTEVPVGYYFEVITKGYAGMPSYSAQIPPADRWRIIAYIRVLQLSQNAPADLLNKAGIKVEGGKP